MVGHALSKSELLTEFGAPERSFVGVDGVVSTTTYQAIGGDVSVILEFASDGLVELRDVQFM